MQTHLFIPFAIGLVRIFITFVFGHCDRLSTTSCSSVFFFLESTVCVCVCVHAQLCLCDPMDCSPQAPLSMGFSRQEYWSRLAFPTSGNLPDPWIEPVSLASPALAAVSLPLHHLGSPTLLYYCTLLTNQSNFSKWHFFFFWSWIQLFPHCSIGKFQMF